MWSGFFNRRVVALVAALVFTGAGCQRGVREDRTITFGPDGRAAFQHGTNGVFVTDPATGLPVRVYESGPDDIATGPPAWDAAGRRMVFAVARPTDGVRYSTPGDAPADGRSYAGVPVRYTCWLHDPAAAGGKPEKLFEAACGHAGYVAAGLAVAWHPDGEHLDYADRSSPEQHRVFTFDLTTRRARPAPLPAAEHAALGSSPKVGYRYAVLGGAGGESGLWVASAGDDWWRVPESSPATPELETLRRLSPRWSRDGRRLAFAAGSEVRVCDTAARRTETWFRAGQVGSDPLDRPQDLSASLHWHPDGTRLGLLHGTRLGLVGPAGWVRELTASPVTWFAGWDSSGRRLAYVAGEPLPYLADIPLPQPPGRLSPVPGVLWAAMLCPNPPARSQVRFADAEGGDPRTVVGGLRATFPHWSPTEPRLSVWLTVEPPYRLAAGGRFGMRPGDPAAVIDAQTGKLDWLPVNGTEHAQIGHAELRLGKTHSALERFDRAAAALPPDRKADWMCFRAIALERAGRGADARDAWGRFEPPAARPRNGALLQLAAAAEPRLARVPRDDAVRPRHRFLAEAFVSLDMASEGVEFFRREFAGASSDTDRLSASVVLCQLLLLTDRRAEYAEHAADELVPLAARVLPAAGPERESVSAAVAATCLPLAAKEFVEPLRDELIRRVRGRLEAWPHLEDDADFVFRLVLRACGRRLNDADLVARSEGRLAGHRARGRWEQELSDGEVDLACLWRVRLVFMMPELLEQQFADTFGEAPARAGP